MSIFNKFKAYKKGASLSGYALVTGLIAVVAISAVTNIGEETETLFTQVSDTMENRASASSNTGGSNGGGQPTPPRITSPDNLSLVQVSQNNSTLLLSFTAGNGSGLCSVQHSVGANNTWITIDTIDCNSDSINTSVTLNNVPSGTNWNNAQIRLYDNDNNAERGTFSTTLSCMNLPTSQTSTPTIDEDCNGQFDNTSSVTVSGNCFDDPNYGPQQCVRYVSYDSPSRQNGSNPTCSDPILTQQYRCEPIQFQNDCSHWHSGRWNDFIDIPVSMINCSDTTTGYN